MKATHTFKDSGKAAAIITVKHWVTRDTLIWATMEIIDRDEVRTDKFTTKRVIDEVKSILRADGFAWEYCEKWVNKEGPIYDAACLIVDKLFPDFKKFES